MKQPNEIEVNGTALDQILELHKKWVNGEDGVKAVLIGANLIDANLSEADLRGADLNHADLSGADLTNADLNHADLRCADLIGANLSGADLIGADLIGADLRDANLIDANLRDADLRDANLRDANLRDANLRGADLIDANLRGADLIDADLRDANLTKADLRDANLTNVKTNYATSGYALACPEEGSFIAWKTASGKIVKLLVPASAKRSSATTRKCRVNTAKVLEIQNVNGTTADCTCVKSDYDSNFIYHVGECVEVPDFNEDRWVECASGVHCFISRDEAVSYCNS